MYIVPVSEKKTGRGRQCPPLTSIFESVRTGSTTGNKSSGDHALSSCVLRVSTVVISTIMHMYFPIVGILPHENRKIRPNCGGLLYFQVKTNPVASDTLTSRARDATNACRGGARGPVPLCVDPSPHARSEIWDRNAPGRLASETTLCRSVTRTDT